MSSCDTDSDYFSHSISYLIGAGGGCKKLFRKIGNRSSEFYPYVNEVRRDGGSYIYEEFVETQGTDVKMYTVSILMLYCTTLAVRPTTILMNRSVLSLSLLMFRWVLSTVTLKLENHLRLTAKYNVIRMAKKFDFR
jgi:hypothetical protein